ncbi:MAG: TetR/AcrR family transcriptional regulator [Acidimicrobiales bacterium]
MAKAGKPSRVAQEGDGRSSATKRVLVEAAIESLKTQGFSGASARAIATRAGCNQALVFYHFGSVVNLLLAALDAVSADRLAHYSAALGGVSSPAELVEVASAIFREDLDAGYATVLVEMIAGASSTPGLGAEVAARIAPWTDFARSAIEVALGQSALRAMIPSVEVAHGVVAFYLGLELLTHLDGDRAASLALFERTRQLVTVLGALGTQFPTTSPTTSATATPQEEHTP